MTSASASSASASASASSPPLQISDAINSNDKGLEITVVAAVLLVSSTLFFLMRLWVRWPWKALFEIDDICTCVAHLFALVQTFVIFAAVPHGLGKKPHLLSSTQQVHIEKMIYAGDLLYIISIWLSRLAIALVFMRLSSNRSMARNARTFAIAIAAIAGASLLVIAIRQDSSSPWQDALAVSTLYRWLAVGALGAVVEMVLVAAAIRLVWGIQMAQNSKITVVSGFAIRILVLIPLVLRLVSLHSNVNSPRITYAFTMPELWTQVDMHLCLIGATVPCLRIFLKSFNTGYYGTTMENIDPTGTMMATKGDSFNMSNMRSGNREKLGNPTQRQASKAGMTTSRVTHESRDDGDSADDRSDKRIYVRQTVNVAYDH